MTEWSSQDARSRFGALVNAALAGEPQTVTRRGVPAVVVMAVDDYERLCQAERPDAPTFIEHLLAIPNNGPDDLFDRGPLKLRNVRHFQPTGVQVINPF